MSVKSRGAVSIYCKRAECLWCPQASMSKIHASVARTDAYFATAKLTKQNWH